MALRLMAFKQIYKILGMECLTQFGHHQQQQQQQKTAQKRHLDTSENDQDGKFFLTRNNFKSRIESIKQSFFF